VSGGLHFNGGEPLEAGYDRVGVVVVVSRPRAKGGGILGPQRWGLVLPNDLWRGSTSTGEDPMEGVWWSGSGGSGWWSVPEVGAAVWCSPAKTELRGSVLADDRPGEV
jgi:hypothetical protein